MTWPNKSLRTSETPNTRDFQEIQSQKFYLATTYQPKEAPAILSYVENINSEKYSWLGGQVSITLLPLILDVQTAGSNLLSVLYYAAK